MRRTIRAWRSDEAGEWVAELSCRHSQHVRHRPPFLVAPWVETPEGRASRIGVEWECPLCDREVRPDEGGDPACWAHQIGEER